MHCYRKITEDLYWVGASDRRIELFENIFPLSDGILQLLSADGRENRSF